MNNELRIMKRGFTLFEVTIVVGIIGIIGTIALTATPFFFTNRSLNTATNGFIEQIREAHNRAVVQEQASKWGIFVDARAGAIDLYHIFFGNNFATGTPVSTIALPSQIQFNDPPQGETKEIVFSTLTGIPDLANSFELGIQGSDMSNQSNFKTVTVSSFGVVNVMQGQVFDFEISLNPISGSVVAGNAVQSTVQVTFLAGSSELVTFSASNIPSGVTVDFAPISCFAPCASIMIIATTLIPPGTYPMTITGTAGTIIRNTSYTLIVNP